MSEKPRLADVEWFLGALKLRRPRSGLLPLEIGTLRSNDADGNENVKNTIEQLCTCVTLFCTFLCPFLHDYDVKILNFVFCGERKQSTTELYFSF